MLISILVEFMSRLANLVVFTILSSSIYITFSVKNDVASLAKKVIALKGDIHQEKERINLYKTEWASLINPANISKLQKELMPNLRIVSVAQTQTISSYEAQPQLANNNFNNPLLWQSGKN
jgi:hypothetical protein